MSLKQSLKLSLNQKLSPMQIQLIKLIKLNNLDLEERIKDEMEINPALEEGLEEELESASNLEESATDDQEIEKALEDVNWDDYMQDEELPDYQSFSKKDPNEKILMFQIKSGTSLLESLKTQALYYDFDDLEKSIAIQIIGNIDDNGYIRRDLDSIVDDLAFSQNIQVELSMVEDILSIVQTFEPIGIGARNLRECLLIQLRKTKPKSHIVDLAIQILDKHFELFKKKQFEKLIDTYNIDSKKLRLVLDEITKLNPKPGGSEAYSESSAPVYCDFELLIDGEELILSYNGRNIPEIRISNSYKQMLQGFSESNKKLPNVKKKAAMFVKQKIDSAKWFIDALKQRQNTLETTIKAIIEFQREYFLTGDKTKLKPMVLKMLANKVGFDISTISRVVSKKYLQTPYGVILLKELFSESMTKKSGEIISNIEIKTILKEAINNEDKSKPLTDKKLTEIMGEKGYIVARRTIAKYRELMKIPVARIRKELV